MSCCCFGILLLVDICQVRTLFLDKPPTGSLPVFSAYFLPLTVNCSKRKNGLIIVMMIKSSGKNVPDVGFDIVCHLHPKQLHYEIILLIVVVIR